MAALHPQNALPFDRGVGAELQPEAYVAGRFLRDELFIRFRTHEVCGGGLKGMLQRNAARGGLDDEWSSVRDERSERHFARRAADFHTRRIAFQGVRHGAARIAYRGYAVAADDIIRKIGKTQGGCLKFPQQRHFGFGDDLSRFFRHRQHLRIGRGIERDHPRFGIDRHPFRRADQLVGDPARDRNRLPRTDFVFRQEASRTPAGGQQRRPRKYGRAERDE